MASTSPPVCMHFIPPLPRLYQALMLPICSQEAGGVLPKAREGTGGIRVNAPKPACENAAATLISVLALMWSSRIQANQTIHVINFALRLCPQLINVWTPLASRACSQNSFRENPRHANPNLSTSFSDVNKYIQDAANIIRVNACET